MTEHVNELLGAYLDGELHGWQLRQVERHLEECQTCSVELEELRQLSRLLRETTIERGFTPADRFASQLLLQLPRQQEPPPSRKWLKAGWWLTPAALVATWAFAHTVVVVSWLVWAALQTGMLGEAAAWLRDLPQHNLWLSAFFSLFNGDLASVQPALSLAESWGQALLAQAIWLTMLAVLYWTWLVLWWFRRQRPDYQNV